MGGVFASLPAYEADLYGTKYVGAIHGRFLTFAACATVLGPTLLLNLRKMAEMDAINGKEVFSFFTDTFHVQIYYPKSIQMHLSIRLEPRFKMLKH